MIISNIDKSTIAPFAKDLNKAIDARRDHLMNVGKQNRDSMSDELEKLAVLQSKGILTDEEFLEQKKRLLQA